MYCTKFLLHLPIGNEKIVDDADDMGSEEEFFQNEEKNNFDDSMRTADTLGATSAHLLTRYPQNQTLFCIIFGVKS